MCLRKDKSSFDNQVDGKRCMFVIAKIYMEKATGSFVNLPSV